MTDSQPQNNEPSDEAIQNLLDDFTKLDFLANIQRYVRRQAAENEARDRELALLRERNAQLLVLANTDSTAEDYAKEVCGHYERWVGHVPEFVELIEKNAGTGMDEENRALYIRGLLDNLVAAVAEYTTEWKDKATDLGLTSDTLAFRTVVRSDIHSTLAVESVLKLFIPKMSAFAMDFDPFLFKTESNWEVDEVDVQILRDNFQYLCEPFVRAVWMKEWNDKDNLAFVWSDKVPLEEKKWIDCFRKEDFAETANVYIKVCVSPALKYNDEIVQPGFVYADYYLKPLPVVDFKADVLFLFSDVGSNRLFFQKGSRLLVFDVKSRRAEEFAVGCPEGAAMYCFKDKEAIVVATAQAHTTFAEILAAPSRAALRQHDPLPYAPAASSQYTHFYALRDGDYYHFVGKNSQYSLDPDEMHKGYVEKEGRAFFLDKDGFFGHGNQKFNNMYLCSDKHVVLSHNAGVLLAEITEEGQIQGLGELDQAISTASFKYRGSFIWTYNKTEVYTGVPLLNEIFIGLLKPEAEVRNILLSNEEGYWILAGNALNFVPFSC